MGRLKILHLVLLFVAAVTGVAGFFLARPVGLLVCGAMLVAAGVVGVVGARMELRGPVGEAVDEVAGGALSAWMRVRGFFWAAFGLLVVAVAIHLLMQPAPEAPPVEAPVRAQS